MKLEELPEDMQPEILALKHGSYTIETDVWQALEEAETIEDFKEDVTSKMNALIFEANDIKALLGKKENGDEKK